MGAPNTGTMFSIGIDVLATELDPVTKTVLVQTGVGADGTVESDRVELWQTWGFSSRPAKPTAAGPTSGARCAQGIVLRRGDVDILLAGRDTRALSVYGNEKDGETAVYADGCPSGNVSTWKADGSINHITTGASGKDVVVRLDAANDSIALQCKWGSITIDASGVRITSGKAALTLTSDGTATLSGTRAQVRGSLAAVCGDVLTSVGSKSPLVMIGNVPLPTPANAALVGPAGPTGAPSTQVFISLVAGP